jgi:hypothetical protein
VGSLEIELTKEVIFLLSKYQNRCRAILHCDPKFFQCINGEWLCELLKYVLRIENIIAW